MLIRKILGGDVAAWHRFIDTYSPYLRAVIHRYADDELAADLFASLLEKLKGGTLRSFSGRSNLSTWLMTVTINHCRDHFRSRKGIRHILTALEGFDRTTKRFFVLYYLRRLPIHAVYESMRAEIGKRISYLDLIECMERIIGATTEKKLGRVLERLLRPEGHAPQFSRMDETSDMLPAHLLTTYTPPPDRGLERQEFDMALAALREAIRQLPSADQLLLKLRYEHLKSARQISDILDFGSEKKVYRRLEKVLAKIKTMLLDRGVSQEVYEYLTHRIEELQ
ncbi:MAG: sigma-70 family RNA polymerase sigma factor [bacterium]|nr:MAG: sigma-70 family RNA polymerase sigma factor [bacterium]